eukprot:TRINITY_DN46474_c0_g1_i1.p1 TRINITY_DN46474_c0_g1~~TRINITY_DN46474_c0_g1_i1.p1  ORF type:complete len:299 (-),score=54.34 TRINITY_DN46474_c0_g1_i1:20-868(-)
MAIRGSQAFGLLGPGWLRTPVCFYLVLTYVRHWDTTSALAAAAVVGFLSWVVDRFTDVDLCFQVVYLVPGKAVDAIDQSVVVVDGCKVKEMAAQADVLDAHLAQKGLTLVPCELFDELGREWVLYGRVASAREDVSNKAPRRPARNTLASRLARRELCGAAVVAPRDRDWRPQGFGRFDWMSGAARKRIELERPLMTVSRTSVLEVLADVAACEGRGSCAAALAASVADAGVDADADESSAEGVLDASAEEDDCGELRQRRCNSASAASPATAAAAVAAVAA